MKQTAVAVVIAGSLCSGALHAEEADMPGAGGWHASASVPVCTAAGDQQSPALSVGDGGLLLVWQDSRPDGKMPGTAYPWGVYGRCLERGGEFPIHCPPDSNALDPDVSGNHVLWLHNRGWSNLLLTTLRDGKPGAIRTIEGYASAPAIDGDLVVWASSKNRYEAGKGGIAWITDIRAFELDGPGIAFDVTNSDVLPQANPGVHGRIVAWQDLRNGSGGYSSGFLNYRNIDADLDPLRAAGIRDTKAGNCAVSTDCIVWQDDRNGDGDIYGFEIESGREREICKGPGEQTHPALHGSVVVWQDNRSGDWDIYGYDYGTGKVFPVYVGAGNQTEPAIYGDVVVWTDDRDGDNNLYMNRRATAGGGR